MGRAHHHTRALAGFVAALCFVALGPSCSSEEKPTPVATSSGSGGAGTGGGGQGGGAAACLDASETASLFTLEDPGFCVVALYDTDAVAGSPTWGAHGGPLTLSAGKSAGSIDLLRWKVPAGAKGKLTAEETHVDAVFPDKAFPSGAIDLPFFGWTAVAWTGAFPNTQGEIVMLKGASIGERYAINGAFALSAVAADADHGRLFYTGLSALGDATGNKNALYAADSCGTTEKPALSTGKDPSCAAPLAIAAWGEASGPVTADRDGDMFAVMPSYTSGDQEARGFAAPTVARAEGAAEGTKLFTLPGFGADLAALAPVAGKSGVVVFQPSDSNTFEAQEVIAQAYTVSGGAVKAEGTPVTFLKLAKSNTALSLMRDTADRLWVGASNGKTSTFAVIARVP